MPADSVQRFSQRAGSYAKYRPSYPQAVIDLLAAEAGLTAHSVVADIGAGTGILTRLLLDNGNTVYAVEPSAEMRAEAAAVLGHSANWHNLDGRSEATGLPDASVDLVTAAQAFHWFEPDATRAEFQRILRPPGPVALIWNERRDAATPFMRAFEEMLSTYGTDYKQVVHKYAADWPALERFFAPDGFRQFAFSNHQALDFDGLMGRLASTSYIPAAGEPGYAELLAQAQALFEQYAEDGQVRIEYETQVYIGRLG
jgi:ubiquinone/menaquinone biosynthesis C-methylase UbiE